MKLLVGYQLPIAGLSGGGTSCIRRRLCRLMGEAKPKNSEIASSQARPLPHILPARRNLELKAFECLVEGSQKASSLPAHNELVQDRDSLEHIPFLNFRSSLTVSSEPQTLQLAHLETDASRLSRSISRCPFISY